MLQTLIRLLIHHSPIISPIKSSNFSSLFQMIPLSYWFQYFKYFFMMLIHPILPNWRYKPSWIISHFLQRPASFVVTNFVLWIINWLGVLNLIRFYWWLGMFWCKWKLIKLEISMPACKISIDDSMCVTMHNADLSYDVLMTMNVCKLLANFELRSNKYLNLFLNIPKLNSRVFN